MTRKFFLSIVFVVLFPVVFVSAQSAGNQDYRERFAREAVRQMFSAQMTYQSTAGAGTFGTFAELSAAGLIDLVFASGAKYGYQLVLTRAHPTATTPARFTFTATPRNYPRSGRRSYYLDESGEMRAADRGGAVAGVNDPVISGCDSYGALFNERCVIADLRLILSAELTYLATVGQGQYGSLLQLRQAGLIPARLSSGTTHGYTFRADFTAPVPGSPSTIQLRATPVSYANTGFRSFYIDNDSLMRGADHQGQPAGPDDPPVVF